MNQSKIKKTNISFTEKYALPYYIHLLYFLSCYFIIEYTNNPYLVLLMIFIYGAMGKIVPQDILNLENENSKYHNAHIYHLLPLIVNVITTWILVGYIWVKYPVPAYSMQQTIVLAISLGLLLSPSINASHELFHKPQQLAQILGTVNMALFQFSVYPIEHIHYHHKNVGTVKDAITSPINKNFYSYICKVYYVGHQFTYEYSKKIFCGCKILDWGYIVLLYTLAFEQYSNAFQSSLKVGFFIFTGFIGYFAFQLVEYIQHYGMIFSEDLDKQFIRQKSSWNSEHNMILNWLSFKFQRHSDHHMNAYKYYSTIDLTQSMPHFRFNFFDGMIMAMIPSLWYYIMNPYVNQQLQNKKAPQHHNRNVHLIKQSIMLALTIFVAYKSYIH